MGDMRSIRRKLRQGTSVKELSEAELRLVNLRVIEPYLDDWVEEDSPKGETVPGVNYGVTATADLVQLAATPKEKP